MTVKQQFFLIIFSTVFLFHYAFALDNPDKSDYIKELENIEKPYLDKISNPANGTRDTLRAYHDYKVFLDQQLNTAYQIVLKNLPDEYKNHLKNSQRHWLKFRDAEFELINNNWDRKKYGSSFAISRGQYTSSIIRNRVIQLYQYAQNY